MLLSICLLEFGRCRTGWKDFGQYCYQFNLVKKSWSNARVSCVNQQADLVSIHSPVEQAHITLETGPYGLQSSAWIGKLLFYSYRHVIFETVPAIPIMIMLNACLGGVKFALHAVVSSHSTK